MKIFVAAVASGAAVVVPAFTHVTAAAQNEVFLGGRYVGQDPDANIRLQLRRDAGSEN